MGCGDASAIRSVIPAVLIFVPPYAGIESNARESDRFPVAAQADCGYQTCRSEYQTYPQTRAAQEPAGSELCQRNKMRIDRDATLVLQVERARSKSKQSVSQEGAQIRSAERNE